MAAVGLPGVSASRSNTFAAFSMLSGCVAAMLSAFKWCASRCAMASAARLRVPFTPLATTSSMCTVAVATRNRRLRWLIRNFGT